MGRGRDVASGTAGGAAVRQPGLLIEMTGMAKAIGPVPGEPAGARTWRIVVCAGRGDVPCFRYFWFKNRRYGGGQHASAFPGNEKERGAKEGDLVALLSVTGAQTETVPPSIVLITIGSVTGVSIAALFAVASCPA